MATRKSVLAFAATALASAAVAYPLGATLGYRAGVEAGLRADVRPVGPSEPFHCDAAPGRAKARSFDVIGHKGQISGRLTLERGRDDSEWEPVASVLLSSEDEGSGLGLQLQLVPGKSDEVRLGVVLRLGGETERSWEEATIPVGYELPFLLRWEEDGTADVELFDGLPLASGVDLPFALHEISLSCSTATARFDGLSIRQIAAN